MCHYTLMGTFWGNWATKLEFGVYCETVYREIRSCEVDTHTQLYNREGEIISSLDFVRPCFELNISCTQRWTLSRRYINFIDKTLKWFRVIILSLNFLILYNPFVFKVTQLASLSSHDDANNKQRRTWSTNRVCSMHSNYVHRKEISTVLMWMLRQLCWVVRDFFLLI